MAGSTYGTIFKLSTFGESHGEAIGGVIDGVPSNILIDFSAIQDELDKRKAVNNFNIQSYLEENESVLNDIKYKTEHEDKTAPLNNYSNHWPEISRQVRENNSWKCQKCSIDLSRNKKLLHTHHKNHIKSDNSQANLVALCALCHKGNHAHMKIPENDRKYILNNRPK